jgi:lipoprotein-anchoring transpeptidase ErfK/SrfK
MMSQKNHEILVDVPTQQLFLYENGQLLKIYQVSTSSKGLGEKIHSEMTPRGWHIIRAKIGEGAPINAIFERRRFLGKIYDEKLEAEFPEKDWILTRIMWLSGLEVGKNRLGECDTMRRYIYIHGVPDSKPMGLPLSHGCIRMQNDDIIELFSKIVVGTRVFIKG